MVSISSLIALFFINITAVILNYFCCVPSFAYSESFHSSSIIVNTTRTTRENKETHKFKNVFIELLN